MLLSSVAGLAAECKMTRQATCTADCVLAIKFQVNYLTADKRWAAAEYIKVTSELYVIYYKQADYSSPAHFCYRL